MNRICVRILMIIIMLFLICSCQMTKESSSQPAQSEPSASETLLADMLSSATLFESECGGQDFDGSDYTVTIGFPYGWLRQNDLRQSFTREDEYGETTCTLPQPIVEELCSIYFGVDISPENEQYDLTYYQMYDNEFPLAYTLKAPSALPAPESDGSYIITFDRTTESGGSLRKVSYHFVPIALENEPSAPINSIYHKGDTIWRISSVKNISATMLPQEQFETVNISTVEELLQMASAINSGDRAAQQKRYLLASDLDLEGVPFCPIGTNQPVLPNDVRDDSPTGFNAIFDGQGHTISNLSISLTSPVNPESPLIAGFFATIGEEGEVGNLTIKNAKVSTPLLEAPTASSVMTGLLAGCIEGDVTNCHVSGKVIGSFQTGGLAGSIGYCNIDGKELFAKVTDCTANVSITGYSELGAFAGNLHGAFVSGCKAEGEVIAAAGNLTGTPRSIGGFCGLSLLGNIDDCEASVYVKTMMTAECVGAFMGYNEGSITNSRYNLDKAPNWNAVDEIFKGAVSEVTAFSENVKPIAPKGDVK